MTAAHRRPEAVESAPRGRGTAARERGAVVAGPGGSAA